MTAPPNDPHPRLTNAVERFVDPLTIGQRYTSWFCQGAEVALEVRAAFPHLPAGEAMEDDLPGLAARARAALEEAGRQFAFGALHDPAFDASARAVAAYVARRYDLAEVSAPNGA